MKIIFIDNYGKRKKYGNDPSFTVEELEDIRIVERNKLRRKYEKSKKLNWISNHDKVSHMNWLNERLQRLENDSASLKEINAGLDGMYCVAIPDGIDPAEYIKIIGAIYYTGYDRGYSDGRQ